eukprot:9711420-Prorocentrum_lima.AAC.1
MEETRQREVEAAAATRAWSDALQRVRPTPQDSRRICIESGPGVETPAGMASTPLNSQPATFESELGEQ